MSDWECGLIYILKRKGKPGSCCYVAAILSCWLRTKRSRYTGVSKCQPFSRLAWVISRHAHRSGSGGRLRCWLRAKQRLHAEVSSWELLSRVGEGFGAGDQSPCAALGDRCTCWVWAMHDGLCCAVLCCRGLGAVIGYNWLPSEPTQM